MFVQPASCSQASIQSTASRLRCVPWRRSPNCVSPFSVALYSSRVRRSTRTATGSTSSCSCRPASGAAAAPAAKSAKNVKRTRHFVMFTLRFLRMTSVRSGVRGWLGMEPPWEGADGGSGRPTVDCSFPERYRRAAAVQPQASRAAAAGRWDYLSRRGRFHAAPAGTHLKKRVTDRERRRDKPMTVFPLMGEHKLRKAGFLQRQRLGTPSDHRDTRHDPGPGTGRDPHAPLPHRGSGPE